MATAVSNSFRVEVVDPPSSYLGAAAAALSAGQSTQLTGMGGLNWALIDAGNNENHLEYGHKGIYDAVRKKIRFFGGPHSGNMAMLEYDLATNAWSQASLPSGAGDGHGYDHNAVDPATGEHYVRLYNSSNFRKWSGTAWSSFTSSISYGSNEPAIGMDWDTDRGGLVLFDDSNGCIQWIKSTNTWSTIGTPSGRQGSYHFVVAHNPTAHMTWLQDANGYSNHWRLQTNGTITKMGTPPITLGCGGSAGRMTNYDYRTGLFVVANPFDNSIRDYDITTDTWRTRTQTVALNNVDSSVEGCNVSISDFGGVILYVMCNGTGATPRAYLYKHG